MLAKIFKRNYLLQIILIALFGLLLWGASSFSPPARIVAPLGFSPLYTLLYSLLKGSIILPSIIALLLIYAQASLLNSLFSGNFLLEKTTLLGGFLFVILLANDALVLSLNPLLCAGLFLILSLHRLFSSLDKSQDLDGIFLASVYVSIASLFYFPCIVFWVLILLSFIIFKVYHWREWLVSLLGVLAVFILLFTIYFLTDRLAICWEEIKATFKILPIYKTHYPLVHRLYLVVTAILVILSLSSYTRSVRGKVISYRKKSTLLIYFGIIGLFPFICLGFSPLGTLFFAVPLSFLFSQFFLEKKYKPLLYNILFLLLLIITFLNIYF